MFSFFVFFFFFFFFPSDSMFWIWPSSGVLGKEYPWRTLSSFQTHWDTRIHKFSAHPTNLQAVHLGTALTHTNTHTDIAHIHIPPHTNPQCTHNIKIITARAVWRTKALLSGGLPLGLTTATTPWPPAKLHTQIHAVWKPLRNTQRDWSPSVVLISQPPTRTRGYQLCRAIYFLKGSVSCEEDENNGAVSSFSQRNSAACKRARSPQGNSYLRWKLLWAIFNPCPGPTGCLCVFVCVHSSRCIIWTLVGM